MSSEDAVSFILTPLFFLSFTVALVLSIKLAGVLNQRDDAVKQVDNHRRAWAALDKLDPAIGDTFNSFDTPLQRAAMRPFSASESRIDITELMRYGRDIELIGEQEDAKERAQGVRDCLKYARKARKAAGR